MGFIKKILKKQKTDPNALENLVKNYGKTLEPTESGYRILIGENAYKPTTYNELKEEHKTLLNKIGELGLIVHVSPLMGANEYQLTVRKKS